jgi:WD40 repeat protein
VRNLVFSPSGSQLAFCINNRNTPDQYVVHVWDRWGKETLLEGNTEYMYCIEYSLDGEYLASGSRTGSIRIWHSESFRTKSSRTQIERPTRTPKQADIILVGSDLCSTALSFSRTDSNLLASGGSNGEIKLWNVLEQACIHSFNSGGFIRSLFFAGGTDSACIALTYDMSIIRLWRAEGSSDFASETIGEVDPGGFPPRDAVFSPSGSFLASIFNSRSGNVYESTLALYEVETMTKTQSFVMPDLFATFVAVSPNSKQLVCVGDNARIRLFQTDNLSIQRALEVSAARAIPAVLSVAFGPTCRFIAVGCDGGRLELRSL